MERKKVAILLPWMKMGGTNKIALYFMRELSQYCEVTLILSEYTGELIAELPETVRVIVDRMRSFQDILAEDIRTFRPGFVWKDMVYYLTIRSGHDSIDNYKYLVDRHAPICGEAFDCVISYHGQSPERLLNLLYRIRTGKRVVWIHGEMSFSADKMERLKKYYNQVDHFFFVSRATRDSFLKYFPMDESKTTVYYNPIDCEEILRKADGESVPEFSDEYCNLLTVGRLSKEKGQMMIPEITRKLNDLGYPVRWYLVGDGDMRSRIEEEIQKYAVEEQVILLGVRTNPYGLMKACTMYVQPSFTEGYSTTISEAGVLGKAIIGTIPSGGIREQLTDGEDGLIVEASVDGLTDGIRLLLDDPDRMEQFEKNILRKQFSGDGEIWKFLEYLYSDHAVG